MKKKLILLFPVFFVYLNFRLSWPAVGGGLRVLRLILKPNCNAIFMKIWIPALWFTQKRG